MSFIELDTDIGSALKDIEISKKVAEKLHKDFPGYLWAVKAQADQGMCFILNMSLDGEWGINLRLKEIQNDPSLRRVRELAGELLERFKVSRTKHQQDEVLNLKRDFRQRFIVDAA